MAATAQFRAEQDILAAYLEDCCLTSPMATSTAGDQYQRYHKWAEESGLNPISRIAFSRSLEERGFTTKGTDGKPRRDGAGRAYYTGLGLVDSARQEELPIP
jgi:putative DNA primase/helicase